MNFTMSSLFTIRNKYGAYLILAAVLLFALLLKLPSLSMAHNEQDERIYMSLAKNLYDTGSYSLQGTSILPKLPKSIYDRPFFHHPPLYIFMLVPFVSAFSDSAAVVVSWLGYFLFIFAIFLFALYFVKNRSILAIVSIAAAVDPLLCFTSQKVWIDSLLAGLITMSLVLFIIGVERRRILFWSLSGVFWGLAILTKVPAVLCAFLFLFTFVWRYFFSGDKKVFRDLLFVLVPALLISAPWFFKFYSVYGMFLPDWIRPDPWLIGHNNFIHMVANRRWYYFFVELFILNPFFTWVVVLLFIDLWRAAKHGYKDPANFMFVFLWLWLLVFISVMSALGVTGQSFQMRFITFAMAPLYLILAQKLLVKGKSGTYRLPDITFSVLIAVITWNLITQIFYIKNYGFDDLYGIARVLLGY